MLDRTKDAPHPIRSRWFSWYLLRASNFFMKNRFWFFWLVHYARGLLQFIHINTFFSMKDFFFQRKCHFLKFRSCLSNLIKYINDFGSDFTAKFHDEFKKWFLYQFNLTGLHAQHSRYCMHVDCRNQRITNHVHVFLLMENTEATIWKKIQSS